MPSKSNLQKHWEELIEKIKVAAEKGQTVTFRCILDLHMFGTEDRFFTEGKEYKGLFVADSQALFIDDHGREHLVTNDFGLLKAHFVEVEKKAEEVRIIEAFIKLCIESMTPHLFDVLVDEIVPALEKCRHITVRSVEELGEEMGIK